MTTRFILAAVALSLVALESVRADAVPDGTYSGAELIPVGGPQSWVVAHDFNRDGTDDLVFLLVSGDGLVLYLSQEDGTFERSAISGEFSNPLFADAAFLDGDELADLVMGFRRGAQIFLGNGDGTFRRGDLLPSTFLGRTVIVSRVDADEHVDILLGDEQAGMVRVYAGDGQGLTSHHGAGDFFNCKVAAWATGHPRSER